MCSIKTFGDKINLSNSTVNSKSAEIGTSGKSVFVTWWETMNGKDVPMLRVSIAQIMERHLGHY